MASDTGHASRAEAALAHHGVKNVGFQDVGRGRRLLRGSIASADDARRAVAALRADGLIATVGPLSAGASVGWANRNAPVQIHERSWVCFPWADLDRDQSGTVIEIDPGSGFGAGGHPTTLLCMRLLAELDLGGTRVLDVGSGTGVLAIASVLFGAEESVALDIAPEAEAATRANALNNGVADRVRVVDHDLESLDDRFDVVVANIHAPILTAMAPDLVRLTDPNSGRLLLSGLSPAQTSLVTASMRPLQLVDERQLDDWVALVLAPSRLLDPTSSDH